MLEKIISKLICVKKELLFAALGIRKKVPQQAIAEAT